MKLGIITDCVHFDVKNGQAASNVHIFVKQMDMLSKQFTEIVICCPFVYTSKASYTTYTNPKIRFIKLPNVGGSGIKNKLLLLKTIPTWIKAFKNVNKQVDIVYQRFPNNLNIPGFFYFWFISKKVFATYTGTWGKNKNEGITYTFQKWLLKYLFKGPIFVYSNQENLPKNIHSTFSPSYSINDWDNETEQVNKRIEQLNNSSKYELNLITVGTLIWYKNQQYIFDTCLQLKTNNIAFKLIVAGDGELREQYLNFIQKNNLQNEVKLIGNVTATELRNYYRQSNFIVQAPISEGFGKVPIEGFFHGCIPILNNLNLASYMTDGDKRGLLFDANDTNSLFNLLCNISSNDKLQNMIVQGREFSKTQTLENWVDSIVQKL